jgi:protocatechuate 3,4-dioxygenase beta subunit
MRNILSNCGWGSARSDSEGRFSLTVPSWQLQQSGSANWAIGAVSYEYPLQVQSGLKLPKKGDSNEVRLVLEGGGSISGAVEFEGRGPMPNVRVAVSPAYENKGQQSGDARQSRYTYTNLVGKFEVKGIGEGVWNVTVSHSDGKAESMKASAGDSGVNLVLKPTLALAGIVLDENGQPLSNTRVGAVILGGAKETFRWSQTDGSGRFRIAHLEPGDYPLEVTPQNANRGMYYAMPSGQQTGGFKKTRTRSYPAGTENIVVEVEPGPRIKGRVVDPGGQPVPGAGVLAFAKPVAGNKAGRPNQKVQPTAFTNGRGEFTLKGVEEGEYEIVVVAAGYLIESTVATVGQERLEVRVRDGGTIKGVLLLPDGKPCGGQWINVQPQDPDVNKKIQYWQRNASTGWNNVGGWQKMATSTQPDGTFEISGLFPGKYKVWLTSPRGVAPQTELDTGSGSVTIRMQPALTIEGKIETEEGGVPVVKNRQLYVNVQQNGRYFGGGMADSDGNFEVKGLPEGEVTVNVWAGNEYLPASQTATAGDKNVRIVLKKRTTPRNQNK